MSEPEFADLGGDFEMAMDHLLEAGIVDRARAVHYLAGFMLSGLLPGEKED